MVKSPARPPLYDSASHIRTYYHLPCLKNVPNSATHILWDGWEEILRVKGLEIEKKSHLIIRQSLTNELYKMKQKHLFDSFLFTSLLARFHTVIRIILDFWLHLSKIGNNLEN